MNKLIIILFILFSSCRNAWCENYVSYHSSVGGRWTLDLPTATNGSAYVMAGNAVEIIDVVCDDVKIPPVEKSVNLRTDENKYPFNTNSVIYKYDSDYIMSSIWTDHRIELNRIRTYSNPRSFNKITVTYIVHFPDGGVSDKNTVTSYDINDMLKIKVSN